MTLVTSRHYLATLRRWLWLPVLGVIGAGAISSIVTRELPPLYEANATLLVDFGSTQSGPTYTDALLSQQLVKTYTQMAVQPVVLEQVGPRLGLELGVEDLQRSVTAQAIRDTQLLSITARSSHPALARDLANTVADVFVSLEEHRMSLAGRPERPISVIQPARLPLQPTEPRLAINVGGSCALALALLLGLIYVLALRDDRLKSVEDAERATGLPSLGVIPEVTVSSKRGQSVALDAYRLLRTAIDFASAGKPARVLLVTSPGDGEGKSTIAVNLSWALAQAGTSVVLVDADLRNPTLHKQFGLQNDRGLSLLLQGEFEDFRVLRAHLSESGRANLKLLTAGPPLADSTDFLQSPRFADMLAQLRFEASCIVIDSPPLLAVADPLVLARQAEGTLLVVAANTTRAVAATRASAALAESGTRILGVVVNRAHDGWGVSGPSATGDRPARETRTSAKASGANDAW